MPSPPFARMEIERGRKLFAGEWQFVAAAGSREALPLLRGIEIAFAGRSNVGKSSLINALTGRRALARISHTPGRTQEVIFFSGQSGLTLVDLPGYGYAAAGKAKVKAWSALVQDFLKGRANLARVYLLIDARHELMDIDREMFDGLDKAAVNYQLILTKIDQLNATALDSRLASVRAAIARRPAAYPDVIATSAHSKAGLPELRAAIARLVAERKSHVIDTMAKPR